MVTTGPSVALLSRLAMTIGQFKASAVAIATGMPFVSTVITKSGLVSINAQANISPNFFTVLGIYNISLIYTKPPGNILPGSDNILHISDINGSTLPRLGLGINLTPPAAPVTVSI